jgi:hypothetical protein
LQRRHWNANHLGEFDHAPVVEVSVWPSCGVPEIVGRLEIFGACRAGAGATTAVAALVANAEPDAFDAVTVTRIVLPTSAAPSVYCWVVLPETGAQFAPDVSHRLHW